MATSDAFTQQIIKLVRSMPDDAILALVKNQLGLPGGVLGGGKSLAGKSLGAPSAPKARRGRRPKKAKSVAPATVAPAAAAPAARPAASAAPAKAASKPVKAAKTVKAAKPKKAPVARRGRPARAGVDRSEVLSVVERAIKSGSGMAASEVAKAAGIPQSRATAAIKELKLAKRIFQGGDRRFARYAGDARTAQVASENARKTASGPILKGKKKR